MSSTLVEVPLSPAYVVERRELREAAFAVLAGELLVVQCHDVFTRRGKSFNMFRQHRFCSAELALKTVIIGSSTKLGHKPGEVTGLHRDDHDSHVPQIDVHYVNGPAETSFEGFVIDAKPGVLIPDNTQDTTYPVYEFNQDRALLPPEIAEHVESGAYIHGGAGTITIWGGQEGFSNPHQFNTSSHSPRNSYVVACHPRQQH